MSLIDHVHQCPLIAQCNFQLLPLIIWFLWLQLAKLGFCCGKENSGIWNNVVKINFYMKLESASVRFEKLKRIYEKYSFSRAQVFRWHKSFLGNWDEERSGRSSTSNIDWTNAQLPNRKSNQCWFVFFFLTKGESSTKILFLQGRLSTKLFIKTPVKGLDYSLRTRRCRQKDGASLQCSMSHCPLHNFLLQKAFVWFPAALFIRCHSVSAKFSFSLNWKISSKDVISGL